MSLKEHKIDFLALFFSAFCYAHYDDFIKQRPRRCYDDECCIAPGELDNNDDYDNCGNGVTTLRQGQVQKKRRTVTERGPSVVYRRQSNNDQPIQSDDDHNVDKKLFKETSHVKTKNRVNGLSRAEKISKTKLEQPSKVREETNCPIFLCYSYFADIYY